MHILLVEDNPYDADLVRRALSRPGQPACSVRWVSTLAEARAALARPDEIDLVLTDLNLPDGHGLDLITEVRARRLPVAVVALTGQGDETRVLAVLKAGADDYLAKAEGFTSRLPATLTAASARFQADRSRLQRPLAVLYVEHNAIDVDLTRRHFDAHAGNLVLHCVSGAGEALERLPDGPGAPTDIDVLLLDFRLTGDNGLELLKVVRQDRQLDLPVVLVTGQGSEDVAAQAMRMGATDYVVKRDAYLLALPAVLENAFHRVQAQREQTALRELNASLERKVAERTAELAAAKEAAERANRSKSAFLARMSHDLRTPLNAVLGFSQLLALEPPIAASPSAARQVQHIHDAGQHLLAMIDEVLDLARIESGGLRLKPEPVDAAALAGECRVLVEPLARSHGVTLRLRLTHGAPLVQADRTRLRQVLVNLLTNAIKYNRPQGEVELGLQAEADALQLWVRDQGAGLTPAQLAQLFQPFNRVGAEASGIEGTGLGLVIARQLVEAMHGRLTVASTPGEGSVFALWLPLQDAAAVAGQGPALPAERADPAGQAATHTTAGLPSNAPACAPASARPEPGVDPMCRVLYVEDNAVNVRLMQDLFALRPEVTLHVATNGRDGLACARRLRPDLVLMDLDLPEMDGLQVLQALRSDPLTAEMRCVAVSANALGPEVRQALAAGFDGYITKPFPVGELFALLDATSADR